MKLTKRLSQIMSLTLLLVLLLSFGAQASAAGAELEMSTTSPGMSAKAGDALSYYIDLYNGTEAGCTAELSVVSLPESWNGWFEGNGAEISHVYVKSGSNTSAATFRLEIPSDAADGVYEVKLQASSGAAVSVLDLTLRVTAEELGSSAMTTQYASQEGAAGTGFTFSTTIQNNTPHEQNYSFTANAPTGWTVTFMPSGESTQVAAVSVPARGSQTMDIVVTPTNNVEAGEYTIPISAISATETLETELTVSITGTYILTLSTPSGRLSFDAVANKESIVSLTVSNQGNVDMKNVNLTSSAPSGWTVAFSESTIDLLEAGASRELTATVTPSEDAMSGDYALTLTAKNTEVSDTAEFRVTVETETIWGIVGVALILLAAAGLWFVFRKYGRR